MGETYYDVLGVAPDATDEEIRAAYRERVLETHPDHNDAPDAAAQFDRVSSARDVLADGTERARYDRLGHDAYVRLARGAAGSSAGDSDSGDSSADTPSNSAGERTGTSTGSRTSRRSAAASTTAGRGESHDRTEADGRAESHHARQRRRRQRQTARQRAASEWGAGETGRRSATGAGTSSASSATDGSGSRAGVGAAAGVGTTANRATAGDTGTTTSATGARVGSDAESASKSESESRTKSKSEFRYAVHDWEGEVDLEWEGGSIDHSTAVTLGCLWLLYPVLVASSLTAMFPLAVNAIVATCTVCVVGYLLTKPRVAISLFGFWSLLVPMGLSQSGIAALTSLSGLLALGFVWVPFGYAVALWWALRP